MTSDLPTTPRAALLALAERIDRGHFDANPGPDVVHLAGILRDEANRYPDKPEPEPEQFTAEPAGEPPLMSHDEVQRADALHTAGMLHAQRGGTVTAAAVVADARTFEAYLRGDQGGGPRGVSGSLVAAAVTDGDGDIDVLRTVMVVG